MRNAYVTVVTISLLNAYGLPLQALASTPLVQAALSQLEMPAFAYGVTLKGDQLSEGDDACGARDLLYSAVHNRLETQLELIPPAIGASPKHARLKLEIVDLVTISAGGPAIVGVHAQLERPGQQVAQYRVLRQGNMKLSAITAEGTECSMIDPVIDALAVDITTWTFHVFPESP